MKQQDETESNNEAPSITRVEVIGKQGIEFSKWLEESHYEISIQDDGRTIKLFEVAGR